MVGDIIIIAGAFIFLYILIVYFLSTIFRRQNRFESLKGWVCKLSGFEYMGMENTIFQKTATGCGAACLEMLSQKRGITLPPTVMRTLYKLRGTSMLDLTQVMTLFKIQHSPMLFEDDAGFLEEFRNYQREALVLLHFSYFYSPSNPFFTFFYYSMIRLMKGKFADIKHWVYLYHIDEDNNCFFHDPYIGHLKMRIDFFNTFWDRKAIILSSLDEQAAAVHKEQQPEEVTENG